MCLTLCLKKQVVYDNDLDQCNACPLSRPQPGHGCHNCKWFSDGICQLSGTKVPDRGWCCHYNAPDELLYAPGVPSQLQPYGYVLVALEDQLAEAIEDYHVAEHIRSLSSLPDWEDAAPDGKFGGIIKDDIGNNEIRSAIDEQLLDAVLATLLSSTAFDGPGAANNGSKHRNIAFDELTPEQAAQNFYVPVKIFAPLLCRYYLADLQKQWTPEEAEQCLQRHRLDIDGVMQAFINYYGDAYGGLEMVRRDWKGRFVILTPSFAIPAVYGEPSDKWEQLIGAEGADRLLRQHGPIYYVDMKRRNT